MRVSPSKSRRRRVGQVTVYVRGRRFWVYYRQGGDVIRRSVGLDRTEALSLAARINAELAQGAPTSLAFRPVEVVGLTAKWLDHHEQVRRSSLAPVIRQSAQEGHLHRMASLLSRDLAAGGLLPCAQAAEQIFERGLSPPHIKDVMSVAASL